MGLSLLVEVGAARMLELCNVGLFWRLVPLSQWPINILHVCARMKLMYVLCAEMFIYVFVYICDLPVSCGLIMFKASLCMLSALTEYLLSSCFYLIYSMFYKKNIMATPN